MTESIRDILVVTDIDGTLLNKDYELSTADVETIRLFRMLGGRFTVASGRTPSSIEIYKDLVKNIDTGITCGGSVIYDFINKRAAKSMLLPHLAAQQALRDIMLNFPKLGVMIMGDDLRLYKLASSDELQTLIRSEKMTYFTRPQEDVPQEWNKVLFAGPPELLGEVALFVENRTYPGVYFVSTFPIYYEMMPKGVSKGSSLLELCSLLGVNVRNTYVIGDYYNDLEMMKQAGYSVAMANAPDEVKKVADEVTASNEESGVAQFLYKLIRRFTTQ